MLHQGSDSAADMAHTDWQEQVDVLQASVKRLKGMIKNRCDMLALKGDSLEELKWAENNEWMKGFLNLCILKDQLLHKLHSRKEELQQLDRHHNSCIVDQSLHAHVTKAVKNRLSGIEVTLKKYNGRLKQLSQLQGKGGIVKDAWLPPPLEKDGLYKLDVDQDIWCDYDPSQFDELPLWMVDPSVKEGIPLAQMVMNCHSEVMCCGAEKANLHRWLQEESYKAYEVFYGAWGADVDVAFFALLHLHELHGLEGNWGAKTESVGAPPDTTEWVGSICPPLLEDFESSSAECPSTQQSTSLVSGQVVNGDDSASSDDDDGGSVEPDREEDAEP